ncbi:MAG: zinc ribbon domain-containing protein [Candidatus Bathyarchaeota archaeon]|nr:zinc ribbon domain-containing protein [Candidatus Bathyarchaeota archaeon]
MVYCSKCGTLNADDANICSNCGATFQAAVSQGKAGPYVKSRRYRDEYYARRGGGLGGVFIGAIIIVVGLTLFFSQYYEVPVNWNTGWAIIIVIVGLWLIYGAFRSRNRYKNRPKETVGPSVCAASGTFCTSVQLFTQKS